MYYRYLCFDVDHTNSNEKIEAGHNIAGILH
jgi:hypothetical protein